MFRSAPQLRAFIMCQYLEWGRVGLVLLSHTHTPSVCWFKVCINSCKWCVPPFAAWLVTWWMEARPDRRRDRQTAQQGLWCLCSGTPVATPRPFALSPPPLPSPPPPHPHLASFLCPPAAEQVGGREGERRKGGGPPAASRSPGSWMAVGCFRRGRLRLAGLI